jgi:hypothetical protein
MNLDPICVSLHSWDVFLRIAASTIGWDGGLLSFLPGMALDRILSLFASQVARITDLSPASYHLDFLKALLHIFPLVSHES